MESPLLRVPEVVARLGVSRAKVYEFMASGDLRSVASDSWCFDRDPALALVIAERRTPIP